VRAAPAGAKTATPPRTVYIAFERHQVALRSDAREVLAGLERMYSAMVAPAAPCPVGELEVSRNGGSYHVGGATEIDLEDGSLADVLRCLRFSVIQALMRARPDLLWFHAGAAASGGRGVLLPGGRGQGKSTLIVGLCGRGWAYLSDEVVPLDPTSGRVVPFPLTPARREFPGREMPADWLRAPEKVECPLPPETFCRRPVPVGALVFPSYSGVGVPARLSPCPPAQAVVELLQHCWSFPGHREAALRSLCGLVARVPAFRLSFGDGDLAADLLTRSRLAGEPPPGAESGRARPA
jgi:hypothetical protein